MLHNLLTFFNVVLSLLITSIAFSNASFVHLVLHSLMVLYEPLDAYVQGLTWVGCFLGWCFTIDLTSLHFIFCEAHATSWIPLPSWP